MDVADTTSESGGSAGARQGRRRFAWPVAVVALLTTAGMTIIIVPGERGRTTELDDALNEQLFWLSDSLPKGATIRKYDHGWPYPFLVRGALYKTGRKSNAAANWSIYWLDAKSWPIESVAKQWNSAALATDIVVGLVAVLIMSSAFALWLHCRGGRLRFRIVDWLVVSCALASALGWRAWHLQKQTAELDATRFIGLQSGLRADLKGPNSAASGANTRSLGLDRRVATANLAPDWLRRLIGGDRYLTCFWHINGIEFNSGNADVDSWERLRSMPFLREIRLTLLDEKVADQLKELPSLRRLVLNQAVEARGDSRTKPAKKTSDFQHFANINQLEEVEFNNSNVSEESLNALAGLPRLRKLVINSNFSPNQLARYEDFGAAHPNIKVQINWGSYPRKPRYK
jgi:hypothetical protein